MAITAAGFDGTMSEGQFSELMRRAMVLGWHHGVTSGFNAAPYTAGGQPREVSITSGNAFAPGVSVTSSSTEVRTVAAYTGTGSRLDYIVLDVDWATNGVDLVVVQGSSATVAPALTQTAGTRWQIPIASVVVRPSVTTIASSDIVSRRPLARRAIPYTGSAATAIDLGPNASPATVSSVIVPDPGWPYFLEVRGAYRVSGDQGYGEASVYVDGTRVGYSLSGGLTASNGAQPVHVYGRSDALTGGPRTVSLRIGPYGMTAGNRLTGGGGTMTGLWVTLHPYL